VDGKPSYSGTEAVGGFAGGVETLRNFTGTLT